MNRFEFGVWLAFGSLVGGLMLLMTYIVGLNFGWLYVVGYGNPPWLDTLFVVAGPVSFALVSLGVGLMYGGGDDAHR